MFAPGNILSMRNQQKVIRGQYVYEVWNPGLGTGTAAHTVLPNTTLADIFCSGQSVLSASGDVLITGGDLTINGRRNFSTANDGLPSSDEYDYRSRTDVVSAVVSFRRFASQRRQADPRRPSG
jgi:hypothetical protein